MSTENEQEVQAPQAPTDEQVMAVIDGKGNEQVEQAEPAATEQAAKAEATAPAASPDIAAILDAKMKEMLGPIQSELGQFRKIQSELARMRSQRTETNNQPPKAWSELTPEQQQALAELNNHWFQSQYGGLLQQIEQRFAQQEQDDRMRHIISLARSYGGNDYDNLDPIMAKIYDGLVVKAENDQESAELVQDIQAGRRAGIQVLVTMAKQELASTVKAKEEAAKAENAKKARSVATTVGNAPDSSGDTGADAILAKMPKDPGKAAEYLREHLAKLGAL